MHQLGGSTRGTPGEIPLLYKQSPQAQPRCLPKNARAGDPSADNYQVPIVTYIFYMHGKSSPCSRSFPASRISVRVGCVK